MRLPSWMREAIFLGEYLLLAPLVALARLMPKAWVPGFGVGLGRVLFWLLGRNRRWAIRNLELVFGDSLTAAGRRRLACQSFELLVQTRIEMLRWTPQWMDTHVRADGVEQLERAYAAGRGVIEISAHLGHFELGGIWGAHRGFHGVGLYRPRTNWRVEGLLKKNREECLTDRAGRPVAQYVARGPFGLLSLAYTLREGKAVYVLIDQNTLDKPVFVDFLGYPAASTMAVAELALATRAPVLLVVTLRQPDGTYRVTYHPPFELIDTGQRRFDVQANMQQYTRALERHVLAHPEQYNWSHPRWRFRPDGSFWGLDTPLEVMRAECTRPPLLYQDGASGVARIPDDLGRTAA